MLSIKKITTLALTVTMMISAVPVTSMAYSSKSGWIEKDGKWYYYSIGVKVKSRTAFDPADGKTYLLDASGVRVTKKGWATIKTQYTYYGDKYKASVSYYLKSGGEVYASCWKKIKGKYYYFNSDGVMEKNAVTVKTIGDPADQNYKFYAVGNNGARITKKGWHKLTRTSYRSDGSKNKYTFWVYVKKGGELVTGKKKIGKKTYLFEYNGYLTQNGIGFVYKNLKKGTGSYYLADKNGVVVTKKGWKKVKYSNTTKAYATTTKSKGSYYVYIQKGGKLVEGMKKIKGKYYYFTPVMQTNYAYHDSAKGETYYFGKSGARKKIVKDRATSLET